MPDRTITYAEGRTRLDAIAGGLLTLGKVGDRVAIVSTNRFEAFEIYLAAMHAGMAATPMNPKLHAKEYEHIILDSGASIVVYSAEFEETMQEIRQSLPSGDRVFCIGSKTTTSLGRDYESLLTLSTTPFAGVNIDPGDLAWLFYTSGTTGRPKGAMETHRNLVTMVQQFLTSGLDAGEDDVMLHLAPVSHGTASVGLVFLSRGGAQAFPLSKSFEPAKVFEAIEKYRVTATMMAPTMVQMLTRSPDRARFDVSSLKTVVYGGAPMHQAVLLEAMEAFGPIFMQGYGQGEAAAICAVLPKREHVCDGDAKKLKRLGSVGREPVAVMLRVLDDEGMPQPVGVPGEVAVRTDLVMKGYWNNPAATAEAIRDGWLLTGDVGYLDEDGYLFLTDRKKDMIISGGSNIYPREIEEVLFTHPAVAEASVIGVPDEKWGEAVLAVVVLRPGMSADQADIIEHCKNHIASFKKPKAVAFVESLPKSSYGKILKRELRLRFPALPN